MTRVLLTGMSGAGKSTLITALSERGFSAVDLDCGEYSHWVDVGSDDATPGTPVELDRDWVWRVDRIQPLLSSEAPALQFMSGCAANMGELLSEFEVVILLTAPAEVLVQRLDGRPHGSYGCRPQQVERVLALRVSVEPLLRSISTHVVDTSGPIGDVVAQVIGIAVGCSAPIDGGHRAV